MPPKPAEDDAAKEQRELAELKLGKFPVTLKCPHCKTTQLTVTNPQKGLVTYLWCVGICLIGGILGCCIIPFYRECSQDVVHTCPQCKRLIGRYDRIRRKAVKS